MAKGVKKIKFVHGAHYPKMTVAGKRIAIAPEEWAHFSVDQWLPDTTDAEKKKPIVWMRQSNDRKTIIYQGPSATGYKLQIPKKLCGTYYYYIEASLSGKRDTKNDVGIYVKGHCDPKIISSKWTTQRGSKHSIKNKKKTDYISYGHTVYLNLATEGLNGRNVIVELYNQQYAKKDKPIHVYSQVMVIDGEVNMKIENTYAWMAYVDNIQNVEEFYVKVKDPLSKEYIVDNLGDDLHAIYLNVKNKVVTTNTNVSQNQTPTKVYLPDVNAARIEPCKFEVIKITESVVKDGKANNTTVKVFNNGVGLKNTRGKSLEETINRTIFFKFDGTIIDRDGEAVLNNILKFLLEHKDSRINLSGHACVIGKQNYNKGLSQRRADVVKKFFGDGGLDRNRIISVGRGEVDPTDDRLGRDNIKYKNEKDYINNRRVDISFVFIAHDAQTIIYETLAPSSDINITVDILGQTNKSCFRDVDKHEKKITVKSIEYGKARELNGSSFTFPINSQLSWANAAPLNYIWPKYNLLKRTDSANIFNIFTNSCRWYSNKNKAAVQIKVYPDIKWTLEFNWNHKQAFVYTYGNKLHPHDIKESREKAIGSAVDRGWSDNFGEMDQSFGLSLKAEWNRISQGSSKAPQNLEIGHEWESKIRETLKLFNKIKSMTEKISNSPLAKGKVKFIVESPKIAFAAKWHLERAPKTSANLTHLVEVGVSAKPLVEAKFIINLWQIFIKYGGDAVCPGAGTVLEWVLEKLGSSVKITFTVDFSGTINVDGKTIINTSYPSKTTGEVKAIGVIKVIVEFKAWGKAGSANIGVEGVLKADVSTSISAGIKVGADEKGIYSSPIVEFAGIKATFVAAATVKFGIFKRKFSYTDEAILVKQDEIKFAKYYLDFTTT